MQKKLSLTVAGIAMSLLLVFPALGAETIKIGALYNLTGGMSSIDAPALNGAKLQAKLINDKGGLLGKKLEVIGIDTELSTTGGTSDGRFIAPTGSQVLEFGPRNATIHKVNECVSVEDLDTLSACYEKILEKLLG